MTGGDPVLHFYNKRNDNSMLQMIFGMSLLVFVACAVLIVSYMVESGKNKGKQEKISDIMDKIKTSDANGELKDRYADIRGQYPDLVGRLIIHNDSIPDKFNRLVVMYTPNDPDKYLYKDAEGKQSDFGTAYLDFECNVQSTTDNYLIYAHNMKNLSQFGCLRHYKQKSYFDKYPTINFETMYDDPVDYEIFAVFYSQSFTVGYEGFKYYKFKDAANEEEFNDYITNVKKLSLYDTGITPKYGEQLITLSTCDYSRVKEVGRFVIVARKKDGRTPGNNPFGTQNAPQDAVEPSATPEPTLVPTQAPTPRPAPTQAPMPEPTPEPTVEPPNPIITPEPEEPTLVPIPSFDIMTISP